MFRIKDLMIKVVPEGHETREECGGCSWTNWGCDMGTPCPCTHYGCSMVTCGMGVTQCFTVTDKGYSLPFRGGLAELKAALQQQLAAVEAQETAATAAMQPRSMQEVENLEGKLTEALQELKRVKAQLAEGK